LQCTNYDTIFDSVYELYTTVQRYSAGIASPVLLSAAAPIKAVTLSVSVRIVNANERRRLNYR